MHHLSKFSNAACCNIESATRLENIHETLLVSIRMKPYPVELRIRVIDALTSGMLIKDVRDIFKVSIATLYRWREQLHTTGSLKPKSGYQKGHSHKIKDLNAFEEFVKENADKTQIEMANLLGLKQKDVSNGMRKIGYTRKKNKKYTKRGSSVSVVVSNESLIAST